MNVRSTQARRPALTTPPARDLAPRRCLAPRRSLALLAVALAAGAPPLLAALDLESDELRHAGEYEGLVIDVLGNGEAYNLHLRQDGLWLPWQAFRASFATSQEWQTLYLPFSEFEAHATRAQLKPDRLKRIGLVAIGRDFPADVCLGRIGYYRSP